MCQNVPLGLFCFFIAWRAVSMRLLIETIAPGRTFSDISGHGGACVAHRDSRENLSKSAAPALRAGRRAVRFVVVTPTWAPAARRPAGGPGQRAARASE